jgi:hypothetical protein
MGSPKFVRYMASVGYYNLTGLMPLTRSRFCKFAKTNVGPHKGLKEDHWQWGSVVLRNRDIMRVRVTISG